MLRVAKQANMCHDFLKNGFKILEIIYKTEGIGVDFLHETEVCLLDDFYHDAT